MSETINAIKAEQQVYGRALKRLRERVGMTQAQAAAAVRTDKRDKTGEPIVGISTQAWQMYEGGARRYTDEQIERLTSALGATPEDLMIERARLLGHPEPPRQVASRDERGFEIPVWGRARAGVLGAQVYDAGAEPDSTVDLRSLRSASIGATRTAGESMVPWAEPGEVVIFDRDRWPRRGTGCVIETNDGELYVKLYDHSDEAKVYAKQFNPAKTVEFALTEVKGVYAIRLRGD